MTAAVVAAVEELSPSKRITGTFDQVLGSIQKVLAAMQAKCRQRRGENSRRMNWTFDVEQFDFVGQGEDKLGLGFGGAKDNDNLRRLGQQVVLR